jgi:HEAT repeat protein
MVVKPQEEKKMTKKRSLTLFTVVAIVVVGAMVVMSQHSEDRTMLLSQLQSDDWQTRAAAAEKVIANRNTRKSEEITNALIDLLDRENQLIESTLRASNGMEGVSVKYGEGYSEYYSALLGAVDQVADYNDERTLNILVQSSYNGDSPFAMKLASYGDAVVPMLLNRANSDLASYQSEALAVLGEILKVEKYRVSQLSEETREQVRQALIRGVGDQDVGVRMQAVRALGKADGKDTVELLERIAQSDPAAIPAAGAGKSRYPVREEALKAISLIENEEKRKPR